MKPTFALTPYSDQLVLDLPSPASAGVVTSDGCAPGASSAAPSWRSGARAAKAAAGDTSVWLIWEDDDVLGVYADRDTAATDVASLRAAATRARSGITYEVLPVPCFSKPRHRGPAAGGDRSAGRRR